MEPRIPRPLLTRSNRSRHFTFLYPTIFSSVVPSLSLSLCHAVTQMKEGHNLATGGTAAAATFIGNGNNVMLSERFSAISRPSKDPQNLMFSDPSIKSASEDEFLNRNSCASFAGSPGYYSDRSSTQASLNADSSSFAMSPWNQTSSRPNDTFPWISHNNPFLTTTTPPAAAAPGATDLFPPGTGLVASLVREEGHIYSLAASGDLLYTGSDSKNIRVWKDHKEFSGFKSNSGLIKAIVISADHRIFTGHQDGKIRIWKASPKNPRVYKHIVTLPRLKDFLKCSMNPSNYVESRRRHHVWIRHSDAVSCLGLDEQNDLLYSGSWDRTLKVWRLYDSRCLESVNAHDDAINAVVVGFHGLVFTGSADGTVKVWRREPGAKRRSSIVQTLLKQDSAVTALAVNAAAGMVYAASSDGAVNFWRERGLAHAGVMAAHKMAVLCLATAGNLLFTGSADKTICIWGRNGGGAHACLSVLTGHDGPVKCLAVEEDVDEGVAGGGGHRRWVVYSGSLDKSVKVWKVWDPVEQHRAPPIYDA